MEAYTTTKKRCQGQVVQDEGCLHETVQVTVHWILSTELDHGGLSLSGEVPGEAGSGKNEGKRVWGPLHRPSLTVRQGLTAFEADLEPEGAVERARVLQDSHVQHRHLGHHLARGSQLQWSLLRCPAQPMAAGEEEVAEAENLSATPTLL